MGKYEEAKKKAKAAQKNRVNLLDGGEGACTEDEWEDSDTDMMGNGLGQSVRAIRTQFSPTPTLNSWTPLDLPDSDDEEMIEVGSDALQYLSMWVHKTNVLVRPKPQREEPESGLIENLEQLDALLKDKTRIAKLAAVPSKKRLQKFRENLPNIHLEGDEILALIDAGSTINAADIEAYFPEYKDLIIASKSDDNATTAGGHQLRNEGRCRIEATANNLPFPIPFQNMKVDVPILGVKKYVRNGFSFNFNEDGGWMQSKVNGHKFEFIEADAAYWIKLRIEKPQDTSVNRQGFTRPGRP